MMFMMYATCLPAGKLVVFPRDLKSTKAGVSARRVQKPPFGSLCAAPAWSHTRQALIFMATFKATMSPFHLGPLGSNESFH